MRRREIDRILRVQCGIQEDPSGNGRKCRIRQHGTGGIQIRQHPDPAGRYIRFAGEGTDGVLKD